MKIKTSELTGTALDWAVAMAESRRAYVTFYEHTMTGLCILDADLVDMGTDGSQELKFSRDWAQGGPIIERERISTDWAYRMEWEARLYVPDEEPWVFNGDTPLIAAMRCYVASKLGDEVDVPEELT